MLLKQSDNIPAIMELVSRVVPLMQASGNLQWNENYPNHEVFKKDAEARQLWIAEIEGSIAGVAAITEEQTPEYATTGMNLDEPAIVVHRLAVDPEYRSQGIAIALMQKAEQIAKERGITVMRADTNTQNQGMQKLFVKLGYTLFGETGFARRPGLRFFCYEKRLSES